MSRLLTDEQVERVTHGGTEDVLDWIAGVSDRTFTTEEFQSLREAIQHDVRECLEGLMEPDEDGETGA